MPKMELNKEVAKFFRFSNSAKIVLLGTVVLLGGTFLAWKVTELLLPSVGGSNASATIQVRMSDHDLNNNPLPNSLTDTTTPDYSTSSNPTILNKDAAGNPILPRFQGVIEYQ